MAINDYICDTEYNRTSLQVTDDGIYLIETNGYNSMVTKVLSKEIFVEAFNKWIKPTIENKVDDDSFEIEPGDILLGKYNKAKGIVLKVNLDSSYEVLSNVNGTSLVETWHTLEFNKIGKSNYFDKIYNEELKWNN